MTLGFLDTGRLLRSQRRLIALQDELIDLQREELRTIKLEHSLAHVSDMQGIVAAWLLNIEQPDIDVRSDLGEFYDELGFRKAALQEHIL